MTLPGEGHNSGDVDAGHLRAFVERIEQMEQAISALNEDKRDIYAEVRSVGFDVKIVKKIVALRRLDPGKRRENEEILALYMQSLGIV